MATPWRTFKFFENESIKSQQADSSSTKPGATGGQIVVPIEKIEITVATCGRNQIYIGDAEGVVRVYERVTGMLLQHQFSAYSGCVTHMKVLRSSRHVLVTIGDDDMTTDENISIIRLWDFDSFARRNQSKDDKDSKGKGKGKDDDDLSNRGYFCRDIRLFNQRNPPPTLRLPLRIQFNTTLNLIFRGNTTGNNDTPEGNQSIKTITSCVVSFDVTDDFTQIAVGLSDSSIIYIRGESLDRERSAPRVRTFNLTSTAHNNKGDRDSKNREGGVSLIAINHSMSGGESSAALQSTAAATHPPTGRLTFVGFPKVKLNSAPSHPGANLQDYQAFETAEGDVENGATAITAATSAVDGMTTFNSILYAVFEDASVVFPLPQKFHDNIEAAVFEPRVGASIDCAAINDDGELYVASNSNNVSAIMNHGSDDKKKVEDAKGVGPANNVGVYIFGGQDFFQEKKIKGWRSGPAFRLVGSTAPIDGEKVKITFHKHYMVLLTRPEPERKPEKFSLGIFDVECRIRALTLGQGSIPNVAWILPDVADIYIIFQDIAPVSNNLTGGNDAPVFVSQKVTKYIEVDTQTKLEQLFKKDMYQEAKQIARRYTVKQQQGGGMHPHSAHIDTMNPNQLSQQQLLLQESERALEYEIQRKYGDHLYEKGKFSEAIMQYTEAIRGTEPSYVIRKFLGEQRIGNLTYYLEALHKKENKDVLTGQSLANKNHTTLLLNCYAKLKSEEKLKHFIKREDITFDASNAIHVCRQGGYYEAATFLARKYDQPNEYVKILLENLERHEEALEFVQTLSLSKARKILLEHGKEFLHVLPSTTTATLQRLCIDWSKEGKREQKDGDDKDKKDDDKKDKEKRSQIDKTVERANPKDFIPVFVDSPLWLYRFLFAVVSATFRRTPLLSSTDKDSPSFGGAANTAGVVAIPDEPEVLNTLLELCIVDDLPLTIRHSEKQQAIIDKARNAARALSRTEDSASTTKEQRHEYALEVLRDYAGQYDPYHALMLVQQYSHEKGILFMLRSLGLHNEVFVYHARKFEAPDSTPEMRRRAQIALREACEESEKQALRQPSKNKVTSIGMENDSNSAAAVRDMWVSYLALLVRCQDEAMNVEQDVTWLLDKFERESLLPPVAVIEILASASTAKSASTGSHRSGSSDSKSTNGAINTNNAVAAPTSTLTLKSVRNYINIMIQKGQGEIDEHSKTISDLQEQIRRTKSEILDLQTNATVFQSNKCHYCEQPLDLPAVHFLCKHSYHQRCLSDVRECNVCGRQQKKFLQQQREFDQAASMSHEQFFHQLRNPPPSSEDGESGHIKQKDGFVIIAEQFGKGIFSTRRPPPQGGSGDAEDDEDDENDLFDDDDEAAEELDAW